MNVEYVFDSCVTESLVHASWLHFFFDVSQSW